MREDIDHQARLVHQRFDSLIYRAISLAHSPAALPIAFGCGILADRAGTTGIRNTYDFLAGLASRVTTRQMVSSLLGSSAH